MYIPQFFGDPVQTVPQIYTNATRSIHRLSAPLSNDHPLSIFVRKYRYILSIIEF